jgi:hypothetical protein
MNITCCLISNSFHTVLLLANLATIITENSQTLGGLAGAHVSLIEQSEKRQTREEKRLEIVQEAKGDLNAAEEAKLRKNHTQHIFNQQRLDKEIQEMDKTANDLQVFIFAAVTFSSPVSVQSEVTPRLLHLSKGRISADPGGDW